MKRTFAAALFLAVASTPALAANVSSTRSYESQLAGATDTAIDFFSDSDWRGIIGGGGGIAPEFIGSDDYEISPLPLFDVEWRGAYFASTQRGVGLNFVRRPELKFGPRVTYDRGRDSSDSTFLTGLSDVDPSLELGVFLETLNGPWRFKGDMRQGITDGHKGFILSLDLAIGGQISERTNLIIGGVAHYAGEDYMKAYFNVSVAGTSRPVYAVDGGGFSDIGAYGTLVYNFSDRVFLSTMLRGSLLMGDAADSPISQSAGQYYLGAIFGYRF